jgi:hypothetical protein
MFFRKSAEQQMGGAIPDLRQQQMAAASPAPKPSSEENMAPILAKLHAAARKLNENLHLAMDGVIHLQIFKSRDSVDIMMLKETPRGQSYPMSLSVICHEGHDGLSIRLVVRGQALHALDPRPVEPEQAFHLDQVQAVETAMHTAIISRLSPAELNKLNLTIWPSRYADPAPSPPDKS